MPKERTVNPATAALKAAKKRSVKRGKAAVQKERTERLAQRNPHRLESQIASLKERREGGALRDAERRDLERLEGELEKVRRARERVGERAPEFRAPIQRGEGKRRREEEGSETDEEARGIPMPRDVENMPPAPRWKGPGRKTAASEAAAGEGAEPDLRLPVKPEVKAQVVYESAPVVKDLKLEAVRAFVPRNIKVAAVAGSGGLHRGEERLEEGVVQAGAVRMETRRDNERAGQDEGKEKDFKSVVKARLDEMDELAEQAAEEAVREAEYRMLMDEAEKLFTSKKEEAEVAEAQLRRVEMEEVEDEDG